MAQNMFGYDQLLAYFGFGDEVYHERPLGGGRYPAAEDSRRKQESSLKSADFVEKLQRIIKPFLVDDSTIGSSSETRMGRYSGEAASPAEIKRDSEKKERRELEQMGKELEMMHRHNQKLITKHGHEEAKEKGMFNYADYMDVEYVKKSDQLRREKNKMQRQASGLEKLNR